MVMNLFLPPWVSSLEIAVLHFEFDLSLPLLEHGMLLDMAYCLLVSKGRKEATYEANGDEYQILGTFRCIPATFLFC